METFEVILKSPVSNSFLCQKAADSLDINTEKKSVHHLKISADIKTDFNIGLIIGSSGSGKTTLAKQIYGGECFETLLKMDIPIIEQFPKDMEYKQCANILNGVGLTSVPCWIRPVYTLSNGQKSRAEAALILATKTEAVIDEWTSVVDRTVAKAMSNCVQKAARKQNKKIILLSCHYDVVEWLNPDWIIDCNKQEYIDRRSLWQSYSRQDKLEFEIRKAERSSWKMFSKYHYLSENLAGGHNEFFGLFHKNEQIGFQCFSNYVPWANKAKPKVMHFNRTVIHPDYVGLGLGSFLINETSLIMKKNGFDVKAKFSSAPVYKLLINCKELWRLRSIDRKIKKEKTNLNGSMNRTKVKNKGFREKIKTYSFDFIG